MPKSKSAIGGSSPGGGFCGRSSSRLLPPSPEATVIDVGCGTGANLASLAADYRCIGIDTSPEAIRLARKRFPGVHFIHGFAPADLGRLIDDARLVLMMDVLEHVPDDFRLALARRRSDSAGGLLARHCAGQSTALEPARRELRPLSPLRS